MVDEQLIEEMHSRFKHLYELTKAQDDMQLKIPSITESIGIAMSMINAANALILEASKYKGDIRPMVRNGYMEEKVESVCRSWNAMVHDIRVATGEVYPEMDCDMKIKSHSTEMSDILKKKQTDYIFGDDRLYEGE